MTYIATFDIDPSARILRSATDGAENENSFFLGRGLFISSFDARMNHDIGAVRAEMRTQNIKSRF
jgi:hypothetical protein